jgi:enoyl-CoA hydratase/carnithine racemase
VTLQPSQPPSGSSAPHHEQDPEDLSTPAGLTGVRLDSVGSVATVTLCRPDVLNAQTPAMWSMLRQIGLQLSGDVRVVVVRGEGRAFSAGLDTSEVGAPDGTFAQMIALPAEQAEARIAGFQDAFSWLRRPDIISVAAVHGHAIGAGFQLALACDLRVLTSDARFTMAEVTLGLVPDLGGTKRLVELVGYARALEICATGRRVGADEAERIGLANVVVPADELDATVADLTAALLAGSRDAIVEVKALLAGAAQRDYPAQLAVERAAQVRLIRGLAGLGE